MDRINWLFNSGTAVTAIIVSLFTWILRSALVPYLDGYSRRKGENRAMQENIKTLVSQTATLTETTENIKAKISDDVWDRQKQWEMRRDAALEAVRAMKELELELVGLRSAQLTIQHFATPGAIGQRKDSLSSLVASSLKFYCSIFVSDLCVGVDFGSKLLAYMEAVDSIAKEFQEGNPDFCTSEKFREVLHLSNEVLEVARKKLNIKSTV
jgi:hypothetical protein